MLKMFLKIIVKDTFKLKTKNKKQKTKTKTKTN